MVRFETEAAIHLTAFLEPTTAGVGRECEFPENPRSRRSKTAVYTKGRFAAPGRIRTIGHNPPIEVTIQINSQDVL